MSYVFDVGDDTVWSPSLQVGDLYVRFLRQAAEMLTVPDGLTAIASDMYEIEIDPYQNLVIKLFDINFSTGHPILRSLIEAILAPSVVILDRAGHSLTAMTAQQQDFLDQARALPMPQ